LLEIDKPFTISPSRVIGVIDPRNHEFSRVDQQAAVEASIRGKVLHQLIELGVSHHQDNPDPLTTFVRRYPPPISTEKPHSVDLGSNVILWAKSDVVVGNPGQNCLCLEIKPGKRDKPVGGLQGRYVLQTVINGLTLANPLPPDLAIYLYNSETLVEIGACIRQDLLPLASIIAISAAKIISTDSLCRDLKKMATHKRTTKTGQAYLFYPDQLSPEYRQSQTEYPSLVQSVIDERRTIFDPTVSEFMRICQRIK